MKNLIFSSSHVCNCIFNWKFNYVSFFYQRLVTASSLCVLGACNKEQNSQIIRLFRHLCFFYSKPGLSIVTPHINHCIYVHIIRTINSEYCEWQTWREDNSTFSFSVLIFNIFCRTKTSCILTFMHFQKKSCEIHSD